MSKIQTYINYIADPRARRSIRELFRHFMNDDEARTFKDIVFGNGTTILSLAGTFTTGLSISGAGATPISITGAFTTGISIAADGTTAISVTSAFSGVNMISLAGTGSTSGILISGACGIGLSITGSCTDGIKFATGTFTDVIDIGGTVTNAINFSAVGIGIALNFVDAFTGKVIQTGSYASAADRAVLLTAANARPASFLFDDGGDAIAAGADVRPLLARTYFGANQTNGQIRFANIRGHIKVPTGATLGGDTSEYFAAQGILEAAGTLTVGAGAFAAGLCGMLWLDGNITATGLVAGVMSKLYQTAGTTAAGVAAFLACKWWNSNDNWGYGLYLQDAAVDVGIGLNSCTSGISQLGTLTNLINVGAAATVTNLVKFNAAAGCVVANALVPAAAPDAGTVGADAAIVCDIGGTPYYIPLYNSLHA